MADVLDELKITRDVIKGVSFPNYGKIYFSSNEKLKSIFSNFDLSNKSVLSVVASGDQPFYFYNSSISEIDLFDINKLAIYYYYLRVWTMKYLSLFYPPHDLNKKYLKDLLNRVVVSSDLEKDAYNYWTNFINCFNYSDINNLFFMRYYSYYENDINDFSNVLLGIDNYHPNFYNINLMDDFKIDKKYDVIYTSNIHEYVPIDKLVVYRDNLHRLLNDNGIIIFTNVREKCVEDYEVFVFNKYFSYYRIPREHNHFFSDIPGYYYVKRR